MVKNPPTSAGEAGGAGLIPGSGKCPVEGNEDPLQDSGLGLSMGVAKELTRLSD